MTDTGQYELLPGVPTFGVAIVALVALAVWVGLHHHRARLSSSLRSALPVLRTIVGWIAILSVLQVMQVVFVLATNWSILLIALGGAIAIEIALHLYKLERSIVTRPARITLGVLRTTLIALVLLMLLQPIRVFEWNESVEKTVVVLIDDSTSMHIVDSRMTPSEKVRLAEALTLKSAARPVAYEDVAVALENLRAEISAQANWLASIRDFDDVTREAELENRRKAMHRMLKQSGETMQAQLEAVVIPLDQPQKLETVVAAEVNKLKTDLTRDVYGVLSELTDKTAPERAPLQWIRHFLQKARSRFARVFGDRPDNASNVVADAEAPALQTNAVATVTNAVTSTQSVATASTLPPEGQELQHEIEVLEAGLAQGTNRTDVVSLLENHDYLIETIRTVSRKIVDYTPQIKSLGEKLDESFYNSLSAAVRSDIDAVAARKRSVIVDDLLLQKPDSLLGKSLFSRIADTYHVRVYRFSTHADDLNIEDWKDAYTNTIAAMNDRTDEPLPATTNTPTTAVAPTSVVERATNVVAVSDAWRAKLAEEAALAVGRHETDLGNALQRVMSDIPEEALGAIVLLTDGRHNTRTPVEPIARQLGLQNVALSSIVFGTSTNPPLDAAVAEIDTAEVVYLGDKAHFSVAVKLDGLTNETVDLHLYDGEDLVDTKAVEITSEISMRTRVDLSHEPETEGMHHYRVTIPGYDEEAIATNNELSVAVNVATDRIKLLLVEGRPSWEFRYIKNLFASRDPSTQLQYVLLEPDLIAEAPERDVIPASAARERDDIEATALPTNRTEWMKFDVIILGDVSAEYLSEEHLSNLEAFVYERGGTLVVVSGPRHMPHAFMAGPLAQLLPVRVEPTERALMAGPEDHFRVALTVEGRHSPIMRLNSDPEESLSTWDSLPDVYWRHAVAETKDGASVLAYARPPDAPDYVDADQLDEEGFRQRLDFERKHALVTHHHVGYGRVLFLGFNHTWRLRYRAGDIHHHRFWGQIMRWATDDKLAFGTPLARIDSDRIRYTAEDPVRIRVKLVKPDFEPIIDRRASVKIFSGDRLVLRKRLSYQENSPGLYEASLGRLTNGTYHAIVESRAADKALGTGILAQARSEFAIAPGIHAERIELAADHGLLSRIATLTGGIVVTPPDAEDTLATLGPSVIERHEREQIDVWASWPFLAMIVCVAGSEWVVRKRQRLP